MIVENLDSAIKPHLQQAKAIYVAVALMKQYGLKTLESTKASGCERTYLVGTNLPTDPKVLEDLLALRDDGSNLIKAKVYKQKRIYHPKVYIIRKKNNELIGFIGSGNATHGGFNTNIEMGFVISNEADCKDLLEWFYKVYDAGSLYDKEYVKRYKENYQKNKGLSATQRSNNDSLNGNSDPVSSVNLVVPDGQFFRQSDFSAYHPDNHLKKDSEERNDVRFRMLELDRMIFGRFSEFGINNLHHHSNPKNYTSNPYHARGNTHIHQDAIWLHYGKSPTELSQFAGSHRAFGNHSRLQVILRNKEIEAFIGIWLFIGMPSKGKNDRDKIKGALKSGDFVGRLYEYILNLGDSYWINVGGQPHSISTIKDTSDLINVLKNAKPSQVFIIGRNYPPDHPDLTEENIAETVLTEFAKLYKIYDLINSLYNTEN